MTINVVVTVEVGDLNERGLMATWPSEVKWRAGKAEQTALKLSEVLRLWFCVFGR